MPSPVMIVSIDPRLRGGPLRLGGVSMREWNAIEQLQRERVVNADASGFIIPIPFRGDGKKAIGCCGPRQFRGLRHII
jgi:hypothetical protein